MTQKLLLPVTVAGRCRAVRWRKSFRVPVNLIMFQFYRFPEN